MATRLDALTLDQIRLFVCVAREGSFSAAARRLHRAQSAVSYGVANLERLLGVQLFDRSGHRPAPTETGRGLLSDARQILDAVGKLHARASAVADGLELDVRIAVDAICPAELLIALCTAFQERFPTVSLQIRTDVLAAVAARVLDGACHFGISGPIGADAEELERRFLADISMVPVVAASHAMAGLPSPLTRVHARDQIQIVISQHVRNPSERVFAPPHGRSRTPRPSGPIALSHDIAHVPGLASSGRSASAAAPMARGPSLRLAPDSPSSVDYAVLSSTTWRVADAATKLALIRAGLGWGTLPLELVRKDLARGALVQLVLEEWGPEPLLIPLSAITRGDSPPGPAGQWLLGRLVSLCRRCPQLERGGEG